MDMKIDKDKFMESYYAGPNAYISAFGESEVIEICGVEFIVSGNMPFMGFRWGMVKEIYDNPENARSIMKKLGENGKFDEIKKYLGDGASLGPDGNMVIEGDLDFLKNEE
ncbi:MAG: hypothetical protein WDK95_10485 [Syntrophorhabdaceae bacterium]